MNTKSNTKRGLRVQSLLFALVLLACSNTLMAQAATAEAAAKQAKAQVGNGGKVLSVREKTDQQGNAYFEVQVISNGNVSVVKIQRQ